MRCLGVVALLAIFSAGPGFGQSLQRASDPFNETLRDSAEISGAVVAGVQVRAKTPDSRGLDPLVPAELLAAETEFCLRLVSANGLYDAENTYLTRPGDTSGSPLIPLTPETRYGTFLRALEGKEIAAAFSVGACEETARSYMLSAWEYGADDEVTLLVNSFRADTVVAQVSETQEVLRCEPVDLELRSAYDTVCRPDLSGLTGEVTIDLVRFVNRQPSEPTTITILLPDG